MPKEICFIVNVDWFFTSHRRPLERRLATTFKTTVIAGDSGKHEDDNKIEKFEIKSRVPTLRGLFQLSKKVKKLNPNTTLIIVSPVMIILCHFLFRGRRKILYNFSGLGFLRSKPSYLRKLILFALKLYPVKGYRVFVVQNSDDFDYLNSLFGLKKNYFLELIAGSGYQDCVFDKPNFNRTVLGYVGRIRKDKGVLDLLRAVSDLQNNNYKIDLLVWGDLDDESRHGFSKSELIELENYHHFLKGFSDDKKQIYNSFNWFCLPSNGEGLSRAAIEAASYGRPLVLSNVPGNRDMIKDNGYTFEYGNIESLKNVLVKLQSLSTEENNIFSVNSRNMFERNWTLSSIHLKWVEILNKYDTISTE